MIWLPFPPTTNSIWRSVNGRAIKSKRYRQWEIDAGLALKQIPSVPVTEPYTLDITLVRPDRRRRDVSNYVKAIEDLLVAHDITPDDSLCQRLTVRWEDAVDGPEIKVRAA